MKYLCATFLLLITPLTYADNIDKQLKGVSFFDPLVLDVSNNIVNSQIKTVLLEKRIEIDRVPIRCLFLAYILPHHIEKKALITQVYFKPNLCGVTVPMIMKEFPIQNAQSIFESYMDDTKELYKENPFKYEQVPFSFTQLIKQSDKQYVVINQF